MDKLIIVGAFLFVLLFGISLGVGVSGNPVVETKEVVKEVCSAEDKWKKLKVVDDKAFGYAAEFAGLCVDFANGNYRPGDIDLITEKISNVAVERAEILRELGY